MILGIIVAIFLIGYIAIAFESAIKINKAAIALITGVVMWVLYIVGAPELVAESSPNDFKYFISQSPSLQSLSLYQQCIKYISSVQIVEVLGVISETLFFLISAMTIVEVVDIHGGFGIITNRITTRRKTKLLWIVSLITFFLSSVLDNMTTSIVMVMLVRRIIDNYKERWVYASIIIIAANSGGAWSPIGDITTIMLWVNGNVTAESLIPSIIIPSLVACVISTAIGARFLHGMIQEHITQGISTHEINIISKKESISLFIISVLSLISVPIFKTFTHLPPFMGILLALGIVWSYTEVIYSQKKDIDESKKHRVPQVLQHIDTPTILFFLGILLSVSALESVGALSVISHFLDTSVHNVYITNIVIGLISSVIDNVPLVAASIAMYPIADSTAIAASSDPAYLANFVQNGSFWEFMAYCAVVGGSVLIIGSVSGVVVMGIEKIKFSWYLKNISFLALIGYLAGALVYILISLF